MPRVTAGGSSFVKPACGLLCVVLVALAAGCTRPGPRELKKTGRVNDFAHVLSDATREELSAELDRYERETCHNVVVLILQSLGGEPINELSARTALAWEVVDPLLKDGVLLTLALDEGQARFEMGTALESIVQQGTAEKILMEEMVPSFREKDFDTGVVRGVRAMMAEARRLEIPEELKPPVCRQ